MNTTKVITAGIAATAVMSIVAVMVAPMMGMPKMDFGTMLGTNNPMMAMPRWYCTNSNLCFNLY